MAAPRVAILGGGITGLSLALRLGESGTHCVVFEAQERVGGLLRSRAVDGFTYDQAGGHILFSRDPAMHAHLGALLGEDALRHRMGAHIRYGDANLAFPPGLGLSALPAADARLCLQGLSRARRRVERGESPPQDFKSYLAWRYGRPLAERVLWTYSEKIWKTPLEEMSSAWAAPRIPTVDFTAVLRGFLGLPQPERVGTIGFYYPRVGGIERFALRVAQRARAEIRTDTPVEQVRRTGDTFEVNGRAFDAVFNTMPLPRLLACLEDAPAEQRACADGIPHRSLVSLMIGVEDERRPSVAWYYLPEVERTRVHRLTCLSRYSPMMAPVGHTTWLAEITVAPDDPPFTHAQAREEVRRLGAMGLLDAEQLVALDWSTVPYAYNLFRREFDARRSETLAYLEALGIQSLGRFGGCEYLNVDQCMQRAYAAADAWLARQGSAAA